MAQSQSLRKKFQRANHAVMKIRMTRTTNETPWVYIHKELDEEKCHDTHIHDIQQKPENP